ncbi:P-loop containing nucleoside triphosphate hydrolase protein [Daedalea quercina L-15889]|uniref:p-loop containing nucleoside triphosphate hydrolase protein n=1 Tax=Daedalea quercina L-15889 TaxID=1314783 RepID=A0A165U557_9APHY|nr:P-loop containing nucleoside triphosphate hydrolase protein [Daedalea quercina L-15889]
MSQSKKQTTTRRKVKSKAAGQRTLFDLFPAQTSATRPECPEQENTAVAGDASRTHSSDLEIVEVAEGPSSPLTTDVDTLSDPTNAESEAALVDNAPTAPGKRENTAVRTKLRLKPTLPRASGSVSGSSQAIAEGHTHDDPIVIDSSPIRPTNVNRVSDKPFYSIFTQRTALPVISAPPNVSTREPTPFKHLNRRGVDVPYPARDCQHVRADQTNFSTSPCPLGRRSKDACSASQACASSQLYLQSYGHTIENSHTQGDKLLPRDTLSANTTDTSGQAARGSATVEPTFVSRNPETASRILADIPAVHKSYPAIKRLVGRIQSESRDEASSAPSSQELWTDTWRPRRADEVLGNEDRALYLRAWLLALKLHIESTPAPSQNSRAAEDKGGIGKKRQPLAKPRGTKRPQIVREVDRRKKRRRMGSEDPDDSWIVYDEEDDVPEVDDTCGDVESEDEFTFCQQSYSRLQRVVEEVEEPICLGPTATVAEAEEDKVPEFSYRTVQLGNQVHNTILLAGPSGCGKTAAVYACAEELGWDVFEVYPGIGERSGAALNKLIGDVGKNHIVKQTQRQQKTFFGSNATTQDPGVSVDGEVTKKAGRKRVPRRVASENGLDEHGHSQTQPPATAGSASVSSEHPPVSQSIVLIEEVDVLFESDANFWPSLINIIRECRRPVVMTCNDASLVPIGDLPLQDVLVFRPPPPALATSYLQCVAILERRSLEQSTVSRLYGRVAEAPCGHPRGSSTDPPARYPDLRQSLLQLQFSDSDVPTDRPAEPDAAVHQVSSSHDHPSLVGTREDLSVVYSADRLHNSLSFADCHLQRKQQDDLVDTMTADTGAANDELGYRILHNDALTASPAPINTTFYYQDEAIMETVLSNWQKLCPSMCSLPTGLHDGVIASREDTARMTFVLQDIQVPSDMLGNLSAAALDYGPWLRHMVSIDDAAEAIYLGLQAGKDGVRKTRNSLKAVQPVRYVPISESSRRTLTHTALRP